MAAIVVRFQQFATTTLIAPSSRWRRRLQEKPHRRNRSGN